MISYQYGLLLHGYGRKCLQSHLQLAYKDLVMQKFNLKHYTEGRFAISKVCHMSQMTKIQSLYEIKIVSWAYNLCTDPTDCKSSYIHYLKESSTNDP